ncbi:VSP [Giardia duodenalis]|uniref:VSP n=1 Tax=Giardia intestinalis (strain ATCC 50803 / WB clone C6) TaxID=184922 RepID=A0A644F4U5_GIAIC|nr:VSP [Giardia intestinalis]KAE8303639.1 VSP [Giardia intestinalis]
MFGSFVLAGVLAQIAWAGKATERAAHCADNTNCAADACNVLIGGKLYCSRCNTGFVPINGQCADKEGATDKCKDGSGGDTADQTCGQCAEQTFMYKGGCYEAAQQPGQTMCQAADAGVCTQAAQGYFVPPGADASHQSVIPCGDEEEITVKNDKKYKGVLHCTRCNAPTEAADANAKAATCTACGDSKIVKTAKDSATSCVTEEECTGTEGFFVKNGGTKTCEACDPGCKTCKTEAAKCTSCKDDKPYLKKDNGSDTGTCVTEAECKTGNTHYPDDTEPKTCKTCAEGTSDGCATCEKGADGAVACKTCGSNKKVQPNKKGCIAKCPETVSAEKDGVCECVEGYVPDNAGTGCTKKPDPQCNTPGCKTCSEPKTSKEVCTECEDPKALTPTGQCIYGCEHLEGYYEGTSEGGKKACKKCEVENCLLCNGQGQCETCKDGYYKSGAACAKCNTSCKTCANGNSNGCTSCEPKQVLSYEGEGTGTCKPGCKPVSGGKDGTCKSCDLNIDGTSYCSACNVGTEYPENGVCVKKSARTASCQAEPSNGVCGTCARGFFRMNGGCYETTKLPGKSVCEEVASAGDTCQTPADGYKLNNGALITCSAGCKTCTSQDQCDTCKAGYAKDSGNTKKCVPCATGCSECNADDATKCTVCAAGYYLSKEKCIACDKSDGGSITGVANCASCTPPTNNKGSVLCYLIQNTNKSGLSAGAIAGISVAVIVVVAGLVGFLCWWFICRGKA